MLRSKAVHVRMVVSLGGNIIRALLGVFSSLIVARGLSPENYGDLMFLVSTAGAVLVALQMGGANAFYTFISQTPRSLKFYFFYYVWLLAQLGLVLLAVGILMPDKLLASVWLGQSRDVLILTFLAVFMQKIVWPMVGQIGESFRKTFIVQSLNTFVALSYLIIVLVMYSTDTLSLNAVLYTWIVQFTLSTAISYRFLKDKERSDDVMNESVSEMASDYWHYCKPLIVVSISFFLYDFLDRWMLQKFCGPEGQAYYQVAYQITLVSQLATTSVLSIFWKEVAEAWKKGNLEFTRLLYTRVNRGLVVLATIVAAMLFPWASEFVAVFLGDAYVSGWTTLALMLLVPIYQSMGQIGASMLMASGNTTKHMLISVGGTLVSIPMAYFFLAPMGATIPGLSLGSIGVPIKILLLNLLFSNLQGWVIARECGWSFDWLYQLVAIPGILIVGYLISTATHMLLSADSGLPVLGAVFCFSSLSVLFISVVLVWKVPWLIGFSAEELRDMLNKQLLRRIGYGK
ncbi:lipopolysaccharide biosynthesis protein [Mariprofundus ferrooxydans]|uniref:lipopolysaccharide biosynthesis protein n=1 Tax=Mariprofundus ferrooxydans TaxID=314344 RepID=UPI00036A2C66|nr:lipopolysaccharide biosynthesis protein [Mariprofundus ferrooxydans]